MLTTTADQWWTTGVGYCLDLERFADSTGDGHGDLVGMGEHLDHLTALGVTFVWLQPFYPSPEGDDGYDVSDYYGVDPEVGTFGQFVEVVRACRERGIRVLVDLVVNHTSVEHPWFQEARSSRESRYRDWYVWRDEPDPADADADIFFPDVEDSIWSYDEVAGQYFRHRFYSHQPDLNTSNPEVRDEICRVMGFWLQLGVAGFRVDAVPYFVDTATRTQDSDDVDGPGEHGAAQRHPDDPTALRESMHMLDVMRDFLSRRSAEAVMLGEVNRPYDEQVDFFGGPGQRMTMNFDFVMNQQMFLAHARGLAAPVVEALQQRPDLAPGKSFGMFVRNHDELSLDQLSPEELEEVLAEFGPDPDHQIFGRGLRTRLPTMVGHDRARLELFYALLFSLPGTPVLYYGEELAQDEDLSLLARLAVRTPVRWDPQPDGRGVADQERDPDSVLLWFRNLVHTYRSRPELGRGHLRVVDCGEPSVLVHALTWRGRTTLAVHHLGSEPVTVRVPLELLPEGAEIVELLSADPVTVPEGGLVCELPGYGYRWYGDVA